jgi:hypothetical protein
VRRTAGKWPALVACAFIIVAWDASARAQAAQDPVEEPAESAGPVQNIVSDRRPGRIELNVLGGWFGGGDIGDGKAEMLTNQIPTGGKASLFTTSTRIDGAPLVEGRVGVRISRNVWVEGGGSYARPDFAVDIGSDVEGAPGVTAVSMLTQVTVDGSLQYRWTRPGRAILPFVMGGAGHLRQLDDTRGTAETGWLIQGGGGAFVRLSPNGTGLLRRLAIRGDVRAVWLRDGIVLTEQRGVTYTASAGLTVALGGSVKPAQ